MNETATPVTVSLTTNQSLVPCQTPYNEGRLPLVLLYSSVLVVGLPANLLTLILTWLQVQKKNVLGVYLWALSLCDLSYLCTLPVWADYIVNDHRWRGTPAACKVTGYIFFTNMYISIFLLCCISFDRYVAVVYSMEARGRRRRRHAAFITLAIVLVVAIGHVPVFIMKEGGEDEQHCFEPSQSSAMVTGFYYARFLVGFLAPLLLLVLTNRGILANVHRSTGLRSEQKRRVRRLAVAVVALFLVCFAPYHLILLARAVIFHFPQLKDSACLFETTMYTPYTISLGLSTINSAINPLLYVLSSENIRKELSRGLCHVFGPRSNSSQNQIHPSNNSMEMNSSVLREKTGPPEPTDN